MTDHDEDSLDARLREGGRRWRESLPPSAIDVPRALTQIAPRRRHYWWPVLAAAAAVLLVVGFTQLIGGSDQGRTAPVANPHGRVVPWAPLAPTHPHIATVRVPGSPDPGRAQRATPCRASQLRVAKPQAGAAAGTEFLLIRLTKIGAGGCRLSGSPSVQALNQGRQTSIRVVHLRDDSVYRHPVYVSRHDSALLRLGWGNMWCAAPVKTDELQVRLGAGRGSLITSGFGSTPGCYGTPGSGTKAPIMVDTFEPEHIRPPAVHSAYRFVHVSGHLPTTAKPGQLTKFTVTLSSSRKVSLSPCPDYTIGQYLPQSTRTARHALNCAAVPYRDPDGHPYLPPHRPVTFAMQMTAAPAGQGKLTWTLNIPDGTVALGGPIDITTKLNTRP